MLFSVAMFEWFQSSRLIFRKLVNTQMLHCSFKLLPKSVMNRAPGVCRCPPRLAVRSFITKRGLITFCRIMFSDMLRKLSTCCDLTFILMDFSSNRTVCSLCFLLLYAHEWHINDVLAFSHRETSHLPFSRHGCLLQLSYQMVLAERTCSFINTRENKMQGLSSPFYSPYFLTLPNMWK